MVRFSVPARLTRKAYDFARQMQGATEIKCSEFGDNIIAHMH